MSQIESTYNQDVSTGFDMTDKKSELSERLRIDRFLSSVQNSGYRMAQLATSSSEDALELVQDAMLQLVKSYSSKPDQELRLLFYRILSSKITDWYRKTAFRRQFQAFFSKESYEQGDPIQQLEDDYQLDVFAEVEQGQRIDELMSALKKLANRQHQAFLLRAWQGFSVEETSIIMGCSTGSVKTHYSRARKALQAHLEN